MTQFNQKLDKTMTEAQFTEVVDAIVSGKYSWACVLILRFAGYNPLHYIPYRTYNRLMKDYGNCRSSSRTIARIEDLTSVEPIQPQKVRGGSSDRGLICNLFFRSPN